MSPWGRVVSVVAVGASAGVALAHPKAERLAAIKAGQVAKKELEVVLAQHNEDASWSDAYSNLRTVYCKGESCAPGAIKLPNVGREGHTYLQHIVNNYDNLADWTVFSQAEAPTDGYFGQGRGGGHLVTGSSFEDYLIPSEGHADGHFVFSSKVHIPSMQHAIRNSFRTELKAAVPSMAAEAVCPAAAGEDTWGEFKDISPVKRFLSEKCNIEEQALGPALEAFWEDFVQAPLPANGMVHYAQGARFSVSRQRLQQRSKAYYQQLLQAISEDSDPCLNYLYEYAWYYMMGQTEAEPCVATVADTLAASAVVPVRALQTGGVSGEEEEEEVGDAVFVGTIEMEVTADEAAELAANDTFIMNVKDSLADTLGVNSSWVNVSIQVSDGSGRRLQTTSTLEISYTITIPEASRAATDEDAIWTQLIPDSTTSSTFKSSFADNIKANANVDVVVSGVSAPTVTGVVTTTTMATEADAAVRSEHGLALTVLVAAAVAGLA